MKEVSTPFGAMYGLLIGLSIGASIAVIATLVLWASWQLTIGVFAIAGASWGAWSAHRDGRI